MKPPRPSKKHHFVPQAQLRHFAADSRQNSIFVFDKMSDTSYRTSILNAGSENDFNTVAMGDSVWNFEDLFSEVDGRSARLVKTIIKRQSLGWMGLEDRITLADLFAVQSLRTRLSRATPLSIAKQLRESIRSVGYDPDDIANLHLPSERSLRLNAVKAFLQRDDRRAVFGRLVPALYRSAGDTRFITSDHPVTLTNAFPYGEALVGAQGVLAHLPLSPTLTLTVVCPTVVQRYELIDRVEMDPERRARMLDHRTGFRTGAPISVDDAFVSGLNELQMSRSRRYLYSATNDFDAARALLVDNPDLRSLESHVSVGEMGRGPGRRSQMPDGLRLVVSGPADHGMLKLDEIDETGEGLTARTPDVELLRQMAADPGMLRVELYDDGYARRQIGEAMLERLDDRGKGWFRVVHRDAGLRALARWGRSRSSSRQVLAMRNRCTMSARGSPACARDGLARTQAVHRRRPPPGRSLGL